MHYAFKRLAESGNRWPIGQVYDVSMHIICHTKVRLIILRYKLNMVMFVFIKL